MRPDATDPHGADGAWRLAPDDVERSPAFESGLPALAERCGTDVVTVRAELRRCLTELRTAHVPAVHAWLVRLGRRLMASGYERIDYDDGQVERLRGVLGRRPAVVLSSHRSYLDGGAFTVGFADRGLPALTVFAGANLDFWPVGAIWRRANAVLIRRAGPSAAYGYALRHAVATLVAQHRPLQWFVEGTRSRSGLLGPPRVGLLVYVVDAYRDGAVGDVAIVPASIGYDQLREVGEYAAASRGAPKAPESLGWLVRFVRAQRGRHGTIHVRFGEPVSVREALGPATALPPAGSSEARAALEALAHEVARRIDAATPVTGTALVCGALLAQPGACVPEDELAGMLTALVAHASARGLPLVTGANVDRPAARDAVLASLRVHGIVETSSGPTGRATHRVAPGRELDAAYHRNTVLSHFVHAAAGALARVASDARRPETGTAPDTNLAALHSRLSAFVDLADVATFVAGVRATANAPVLPGPFVAAMLGPLFEAMATVEYAAEIERAPAVDDAARLRDLLALASRRVADGTHVYAAGVSLPLLERALQARRAGVAATTPGSMTADDWLARLRTLRESPSTS